MSGREGLERADKVLDHPWGWAIIAVAGSFMICAPASHFHVSGIESPLNAQRESYMYILCVASWSYCGL